jgi:hypothetical protein
MQSLDINRPAEPSSRVVVSAILIDCPAVAVTTTAVPSSYFVPTVSTDYCLCYSRSVLLPDLLDLLCRPTVPTDLFRSTVSTDCSTATATAVPTSYFTAVLRPFRSAVSIVCCYCTDRLLLTDCYRPSYYQGLYD